MVMPMYLLWCFTQREKKIYDFPWLSVFATSSGFEIAGEREGKTKKNNKK